MHSSVILMLSFFDDVEINIWIRENVKGEKETKHIIDFTVQSFLEIVQIIH